MVKVIIMGRCCRISFDFQKKNLRNSETSLFEWVWTDTLGEINFVLQKIVNNEEIKLVRPKLNPTDCDQIEGTNIIYSPKSVLGQPKNLD